MADPPDFRLEHSELRGADEFDEFDSVDLPYYADWHGSFEKTPWPVADRAGTGGAGPLPREPGERR